MGTTNAAPLTLSIVICSKDRTKDLRRCLASIRYQEHQPDEIIVVDQSAAPYDFLDTNIVHVYAPQLTGLAQARNVAMRSVRSDVVLFLDDDVELIGECVLAVKTAFAKHESAIGIACSIRVPPPTNFPHEIRQRIFVRAFEHGFFNGRGVRRRDGVEMLAAEGCGMAFRTWLFDREQVDERLQGYSFGEDWEFSLRARRHGKIWLAEDAIVMHYKSPANRWSSKRLLQGRWANFLYFYDKHNARASLPNRFWRHWWMLGESLRWAWVGIGFPILGIRAAPDHVAAQQPSTAAVPNVSPAE